LADKVFEIWENSGGKPDTRTLLVNVVTHITPLSELQALRLYEPEAGVDQIRALWTWIFTFILKILPQN